MSSRQLRKLRQQQELLALQKENIEQDAKSGTDEEESVQVSRPAKPKFSGFAALAGNDDDAEDDADDVGEAEGPETTQPVAKESVSVTKNKKSKKKKKKGKKVDAVPLEEPSPAANNELDEIDRAIRELDLDREEAAATTATGADTMAQASQRVSKLLCINFQHLKLLNEMRRLFGKEAMESAEHEEEAQNAHGRRQRQRAQQQIDLETFLRGQPGKVLPEVVRRRNPFIEGKSTWPRATAGGLTMTTIGDPKSDVAEFAFAHDKEYDLLESQFFFLVGMHDPQKLIFFLQQHPYHISTLIQVSRVAHQDQNAALAAELCERALFTFGRVTLSSFRKKLEEGKARLSFMRPENRQFWLAGYHYIKNTVRKGTYRTALEWAKLFLSIDHSDPYGMLNWIHVLAIRSREAQWFVDLCESNLLRNKSASPDNARYVRQTKTLAQLQLGDRTGAKVTLRESMEEVRWFYTKLFGALDIDVPPSLWGVMPPNDDDQLFTDLYLHLAKDLWNNTEVITLLQEVASTLPQPPPDTQTIMPSLVSLSTARFVYLEGKAELMGGIPRGMLHATPNFDFDPLPPPLDDNIFSNEKQKLPWTTNVTTRTNHMDLPPAIRALLRMGPGAREEQLREAEALADAQGVPEEERGHLRHFINMLFGGRGDGEPERDAGVDADEDAEAEAEADLPDDRGMMRRFMDMLGAGSLGLGLGFDGRIQLQMPGGFLPSDDEFGADGAEEWDEDYEDEFDDELDMDDLIDDFGDQHDDDDDDDGDSMPDLIPHDA